MRKGTLEYCILLILARRDAYTSQIIDELKRPGIIVVEGTLYPMLNRLRADGMLGYRWEESPQGPPRKFYAITDRGRELLVSLNESWRALSDAIDQLKQHAAE